MSINMTTCLHVNVCRQNGPAQRISSWDEVYLIWPLPRRPNWKHAEPSVFCSSRGALMSYSDRSARCCSNRTKKGTLVKHIYGLNLVYELAISLSISAPKPPPHPPSNKKYFDLDDSHKWHILVQKCEFSWKATRLQVCKYITVLLGKARVLLPSISEIKRHIKKSTTQSHKQTHTKTLPQLEHWLTVTSANERTEEKLLNGQRGGIYLIGDSWRTFLSQT